MFINIHEKRYCFFSFFFLLILFVFTSSFIRCEYYVYPSIKYKRYSTNIKEYYQGNICQNKNLCNTMQGVKSLIAIICMSLILIFALIHLAVSISILGKFGRYGDVFRPERGLAGFNIVISIFGLIISGFGLFSILTDRRNLSKCILFFMHIPTLLYQNYMYICFSR